MDHEVQLALDQLFIQVAEGMQEANKAIGLVKVSDQVAQCFIEVR